MVGVVAAWFAIARYIGRISAYYPRPERRRTDRTHPGWHNYEDGAPGGPRGRVWTDLERDEYREKQRNKVIRLQDRFW